MDLKSEKTLAPTGRCSRAVAFGRDYFHAISGTNSCSLNHSETESIHAHSWDRPPWSTERDDEDIIQADCTAQSTLFLTTRGQVFQTGTLHGKVHPQPVPITIPLPLKCVQIACGRHFCLGRMEGGLAVVSWGAGHFGQLGLGGGDEHHHVVAFSTQPTVIERLLPHIIGSPVRQVAAGDWHALALTDSGRIWAWGANRNLQCGRKPPKASPQQQQPQAPTVTRPLPVSFDIPARQIAAGRSHSVALTQQGVYCWGSSNHGQCGNSVRKVTGVAPPRKVDGLGELAIQQIAAGGDHTVALTTGGRIFTWGCGSEGQLGLGPAVPSQCKPRLVADLDFVAISAGQEWKQQQRNSDERNDSQHFLQNVPTISSVYAGDAYTAAISTTGHVYIWGSNDAGQIGIPKPSKLPFKDGYFDSDLSASGRTTSLRDLHVQTFDSTHNVLLPLRLDSIRHLRVQRLACGPNHLWCLGHERSTDDCKEVGKTLYEVQEVSRASKLQRARRSLEAKARRSIVPLDGDFTETSCEEDMSEVTHSVTALCNASERFNDDDTEVHFTRTDVTSSTIFEKEGVQQQEEDTVIATTPAVSSTTPKSRQGILRRFSLRRILQRMASGKSWDKERSADSEGAHRNRRRSRRSSRRSSL